MPWVPNLQIEPLTAIDVHVHIESDGHDHFSLDRELMDASAAYFKSGGDRTPTLERIADLYRGLNMAAVVFTVDASTATGASSLRTFRFRRWSRQRLVTMR